jgi:hypothetical protein
LNKAISLFNEELNQWKWYAYRTGSNSFASSPAIQYLSKRMPAAKRHKLQKLQTIVRKLALGLTVEQACARVGVSHDWFHMHTRPGTPHAAIRDKAEAAMISARLRAIDKIGKAAFRDGDYKTALNAETWRLEKIYRRQYGQDERNLYINAQQINYAPSEEKVREIEARRQASLARLEAQGIIGNGETNRSGDNRIEDGHATRIS